MAIQSRRGPENELDKSKLLPAETATTLDTKKIFHAFAPGDVHQMATVEEMHTAIEQVTEDIRQDFTEQVEEATDNANMATGYATTQGDYAKAQGDYAYEKGQEAQTIVDSAAPIVNTNLQASYADKGTITGPSVQFPTADNGLVEITNIQGKYSQAVTVQGKQLFDKAKVSAVKYIQPVTGAETTSSFSNNASAKIYTGTETNVTISGHTFVQPNTPVGIAFYNSSNSRIGGTSYQGATGNGTYAIPAGTFYLRYTINNVDLNTSQAEFGTVATSYAAYVPNSPSPDYPSVIHNVGDVPFEAGACGKNNLNNTAVTTTVNGVTFTVNADKSITINGTSTAVVPLVLNNLVRLAIGTYTLSGVSENAVGVTIEFKHVNVSGSLIASANYPQNKTFTINSYLTDGYMYLRIPSGITVNNLIIKPQLELGSTATPYEPYKGNQTPVTGQYGALPDGTRDEFIFDGVTAKKIQRRNRIIFDGSSDESWVKNSTNVAGRVRFSINITDKKIDGTINGILCDKLIPVSYTSAFSSPPVNPSISGHNSVNTINVYGIMFDSMTTSQDFKNWLATNPITVDYPLVTPIESPRDRIFLTSYSGITNAYTTDPLQPTFTAVAKSELWSKDYLINLGIKALQDGKINKTDIVNTDTVNDTTKVASAAVVRALGIEIDTVNNNLAVNLSLSAAEHAVGTDADGKIIYSRTLTYNVGTGTTPQATLTTVSGATKMWIDEQNTFWTINSTTQRFTSTFFTSSGLQSFCFCIGNTINYSKPTSALDLSLTVTVRYTK